MLTPKTISTIEALQMSTLTAPHPITTRASIELRPGTPEDAAAAGLICHQAFTGIASAHGFPSDCPTPESGIGLLTMLLSHPGFYSVVAERQGSVVGSNFLDERSTIAGVGPITVDPAVQNDGIGRLLMQNVLDRAGERGFPGVRLLQDAYHNRSLALYSRLGFQVRDVVACMQGPPLGLEIPGYHVRPATSDDEAACNQLSLRVHGHDRAGELRDAVAQGTAVVVEHLGRITGYSTATAFFGHTIGETTEDLKALIGAAQSFDGPGILVPVRNSALFQWSLQHRLRISFLTTLMTIGLYNEPSGAYLPSILY
jgi:predicted N-acetyltransferase YhbS